MFMYKFDYKPQLLYENLQNMIENTAAAANNNIYNNKSTTTTNHSFYLNKDVNSSDQLNYTELDEQLEDLARIKLEDIEDYLGQASSSTTTASTNNNVQLKPNDSSSSFSSIFNNESNNLITATTTESGSRRGSFISNIFKNFKTTKDTSINNNNKTNTNSNSNNNIKLEMVDNTLNINIDDDMMVSLLNDTKIEDININYRDDDFLATNNDENAAAVTATASHHISKFDLNEFLNKGMTYKLFHWISE